MKRSNRMVVAKTALLVSILFIALQSFRTIDRLSILQNATSSITQKVQANVTADSTASINLGMPRPVQQSIPSSPPPLPLPYTASHTASSSCEGKYGLAYLYDTASTGRLYCDVKSGSQLSCFHNNMGGRIDTFCIASVMTLPTEADKFELDCKVRDWNSDDLAGSPRIENFREEWYMHLN